MRGIPRALALGLVLAFVATACGTGGDAGSSPAAATSQAATKPRLDLSTYQYALQTKGKIRIGTQEDNTPFSVKMPATEQVGWLRRRHRTRDRKGDLRRG